MFKGILLILGLGLALGLQRDPIYSLHWKINNDVVSYAYLVSDDLSLIMARYPKSSLIKAEYHVPKAGPKSFECQFPPTDYYLASILGENKAITYLLEENPASMDSRVLHLKIIDLVTCQTVKDISIPHVSNMTITDTSVYDTFIVVPSKDTFEIFYRDTHEMANIRKMEYDHSGKALLAAPVGVSYQTEHDLVNIVPISKMMPSKGYYLLMGSKVIERVEKINNHYEWIIKMLHSGFVKLEMTGGIYSSEHDGFVYCGLMPSDSGNHWMCIKLKYDGLEEMTKLTEIEKQLGLESPDSVTLMKVHNLKDGFLLVLSACENGKPFVMVSKFNDQGKLMKSSQKFFLEDYTVCSNQNSNHVRSNLFEKSDDLLELSLIYEKATVADGTSSTGVKFVKYEIKFN